MTAIIDNPLSRHALARLDLNGVGFINYAKTCLSQTDLASRIHLAHVRSGIADANPDIVLPPGEAVIITGLYLAYIGQPLDAESIWRAIKHYWNTVEAEAIHLAAWRNDVASVGYPLELPEDSERPPLHQWLDIVVVHVNNVLDT